MADLVSIPPFDGSPWSWREELAAMHDVLQRFQQMESRIAMVLAKSPTVDDTPGEMLWLKITDVPAEAKGAYYGRPVRLDPATGDPSNSTAPKVKFYNLREWGTYEDPAGPNTGITLTWVPLESSTWVWVWASPGEIAATYIERFKVECDPDEPPPVN